jgi:hypothetical protein
LVSFAASEKLHTSGPEDVQKGQAVALTTESDPKATLTVAAVPVVLTSVTEVGVAAGALVEAKAKIEAGETMTLPRVVGVEVLAGWLAALLAGSRAITAGGPELGAGQPTKTKARTNR